MNSSVSGIEYLNEPDHKALTKAAAGEHINWQPRDYEANVLLELFRLSRVTLLYGAAGAGKTTLLHTQVLSNLQRRADERYSSRNGPLSADKLFPERRCSKDPQNSSAEFAILFDQWRDAPLSALQEMIRDRLPVGSPPCGMSLRDSLATWSATQRVRFFIIFDQFEEYLRSPLDRAGVMEFADEFVDVLCDPLLPANFLISLRDDAEPLLNSFRGRVRGFGDAYLRLPNWQRAITLPLDVYEERTTAAAAPALEAESVKLTGSTSASLMFADVFSDQDIADFRSRGRAHEALAESTGPANDLDTGRAEACIPASPALETDRILASNRDSSASSPSLEVPASSLPLMHPAAQNLDEGAARLNPRSESRVRNNLWIPAAAFSVGILAGATAVYFAIHELSVTSASLPVSTNNHLVITTERSGELQSPSIPLQAGTVDRPSPPAPKETSAAQRVQPAHASKAPRQRKPAPTTATVATESRKPPPATVTMADPTVLQQSDTSIAKGSRDVIALESRRIPGPDWQTAMRKELIACRNESSISALICTEKVRWRHCAPNRWNTIAECAVAARE